MLGERRAAILSLIIEHYIKTGEPIGSKTLAALLPYSVSSATIRNEMAYLSQLGYLEQRHTSGGRVPGKNAYRFYVDNLMIKKELLPQEQQRIDEILSVNAGDSQRLVNDAARLLADVTRCASFCSTIADKEDSIQGVQLIPAGSGRAMLVMLTTGGRIKSSICRLNCPANEEFTAAFYEVVNNAFIGTRLIDVSLATVQSASVILGARIFDMLPVLSSLCALCTEAAENTLTIEGETNLLSHEELGNDVYKLLAFLTNKNRFITLAKSFADSNKGSALFIGNENPYYELKNTTMMTADLRSGNRHAVLGIIGSTRIDYSVIVPRVQYIFNKTSQLLSEGGAVNG